MIGSSLAHFEITGKLGQGGMGEVYRAKDKRLAREVAIKVLPAQVASDPERLARFRREAQLLASLSHSNIAAIYSLESATVDDSADSARDSAERGGSAVDFLVMELVEGEDLAAHITGGPVPVREALRFGIEIAKALEAAHKRDIVHRDLKPANVMVTSEGAVKVLDFGLAKIYRSAAQEGTDAQEAATATAGLTAAGAILGTAAYMSPEQIRGEPVDEQTDLWAFGCVLYQMLTGRAPFGSDSDPDSMAAILRDEPVWTELPSDLPPRIETLIRRCLRKDAGRRVHHAADVRIELEEALQAMDSSEPSFDADREHSHQVGREPDAGHRESVSAEPRRMSATTKALIAVALLAVLVVAGWLLLDPAGSPVVTDRSIAVLPFETLGEKRPTSFTDGIHGDMLTRLSQVSDLRVVSRTSVMRYRDTDQSLPAIARELGVAWILGADVQEVGNQVQVNARLMNAERDQQVWAESYRRELTAENLFDIQSEITGRVVTQLQAQLSPQEKRAVDHAPTADLDAYRLYIQGRALLEQRTADAMWRAVDYFRRALDRDSEYALAWAGLGDALVLMNWYGYPVPETGFGPMQAVQRALAINPDLGEAHAALGLLHAYRLEGPQAVRALERATELRSSYAQAQGWLCFAYLLVGRPESAIEVADRTAGLQPPPETRAEMAEAYLAGQNWQQALAQAQRAQQLQPEYKLAQFLEGLALYQLARLAEAKSILSDASVAFISPGHLATIALAEVALGQTERAHDLLVEIDAAGGSPFWSGLVRAALGETDAAFEDFHRVERWGDWPTLPFRYYYPDVLGPLRESDSYRTLLGEVNRQWGLEPDGSFPDLSDGGGRSGGTDPNAISVGTPVEVVTTETGANEYRVVATTTLDSPAAEVWSLLQDWEQFLAVGLPEITSEFTWLTGGPGRVPSTFQFAIGEAWIEEEIYLAEVDEDTGRYVLRYRMLEPVLGVLYYDAIFELEEITETATAFSAVRELRFEPGTGPEALAELIEDETRRLRDHFAADR